MTHIDNTRDPFDPVRIRMEGALMPEPYGPPGRHTIDITDPWAAWLVEQYMALRPGFDERREFCEQVRRFMGSLSEASE